MAGTYITSRREETSFFSLLYYLMETAEVSTDGDGKIIASNQKDFASQLIQFVPVGQFVWRDDRGKMRLGASLDSRYGLLWTNDESPYEADAAIPLSHYGVFAYNSARITLLFQKKQ